MPRRNGRDAYRSGKAAAKGLEHARRELAQMREKYPHLFKADGVDAFPPNRCARCGSDPCRCKFPGMHALSFHCSHGVPWKECTLCSKPVRRA